ncbi:major facilitator superfamily protein [Escherichia coli]|nr:major facilitator superfamily protein [Escherichia coli]
MNLSLRRSTSALLASSLLLTIGRGATLPFMTIYLSRQYSLSVDLIGYAMTIALTIGVVFSLGFGILADKFDKKRYMLLAITAFASGFIAITLVNNVTLVVLFFALINCAYSVFATVLKSLVCRQSFVHQQNENLLNQLHHAKHWLDHRSAARHAVGNAEHQSALLAGSYLFRVSHAFHSNLGKAQRENHRHGNRQCLVAESFITR